MRLFDSDKVGCYCDTVGHQIENRRGTDVKVVVLGLKVSPLSADLAAEMADGIKPTLFAMTDATAKVTRLSGASFTVADLKRQIMSVFATPDTVKPSIVFDQAVIGGIKARVGKGRNDYDLTFSATFGPLGPKELEFVQAWHLSQRFVTFEAAEPLLEMGDEDDANNGETTEADEKAGRRFVPPTSAAPEWNDDGTGSGKPEDAPNQATADAEREIGVNRPLHSHQSRKNAGNRKAATVTDIKSKTKKSAAKSSAKGRK